MKVKRDLFNTGVNHLSHITRPGKIKLGNFSGRLSQNFGLLLSQDYFFKQGSPQPFILKRNPALLPGLFISM